MKSSVDKNLIDKSYHDQITVSRGGNHQKGTGQF